MVAAGRKGRAFHLRAFVFFEALTLGAGIAGGLLGGTSGFQELRPPPLTPPAWVFPAVWTALYLLMGLAAYLIWNTRDIDGPRVLRLYLLQLAVNVLWPFLFFRLGWRLFAFFWLLFLTALITLTLTGFRYIRRSASRLLLPYLAWTLYAGYLNLGFYLLNI
ncbi:MAG: tryptophan-rich sensory protein [Clostridiales bacterium]|nr:tryptophan-rich sensory protein [Clostridiales bacterium]